MRAGVEMLGEVASVPYGIDHGFRETIGVIGAGAIRWRLSPDELREIADEIEAHEGGDDE